MAGDMLNIQILGTAAAEGWPALFCTCDACKGARQLGGKNLRTRSGMMVDETVMIDFSPDAYMHERLFGLDYSKLEHVFITHSHSDHFLASDILMRKEGFAHTSPERPQPLYVYGNQQVHHVYNALRQWEGNTEVGLDNRVQLKLLKEFETVQAGEYTITPYRALHDKREDCLFFGIEKMGASILYGHDTGYFPQETWQQMKGNRFDVVLLDCTMGPQKEGSNHMGLPDNVQVRERMLQEGIADDSTRFVITHFSHNGGLLHDELSQMAAKLGFDTAYDGMEISIPCKG